VAFAGNLAIAGYILVLFKGQSKLKMDVSKQNRG
jgi:hypothetical protein